MTVKKKNLSDLEGNFIHDASGMRMAIVVADWNKEITDALLDGTLNTLYRHGVIKDDVFVFRAPGSFELPQAASVIIHEIESEPDAVICLGCVIQGETRHFEFIAKAVAQGCMDLGIQSGIPVIFGVLTTDTYEQARERAGGKHGNKGDEAAIAAIKMSALRKTLQK